MIIFDEATSNLDVESEGSIWETIYDLSKEKTIVVISHRLANVKEVFNGENIEGENINYKKEEVIGAAKKASVHDFILSPPKGI